ncbi:condensin subunit YCS4 Ecym_3121 [Eremothecium cymbalariae DBVPG|uniref:Condensin complex subunit 1 n=1 Tax=Eremothecium cymbalariae (strain CBS 270.75 / DBVPG 7215 / KCTC 17166 / NRRL Y-17582) TaxID=931890 RepID=G8JR56_ERECY|nr:Hypothetical protein Ecym_3121 [Eremothecium cymbalariae DBVPG\
MVGFRLSAYLTRFQTCDKRSFPPVDNANREINLITDRLAISPEDIYSDEELLDTLIDLAHGFSHLLPKLQQQLSYLVSSCLKNLAQTINVNLSSNASNDEIIGMLPLWKSYLERYGYLLHVMLIFLQEDVAAASIASTGKSSSKRQISSSTIDLFKRSCDQIEGFLEAVVKVLDLNLSKMFQTTAERDLFIGLYTKPLFVLIETEQVVKVHSLKMFTIRIIATSVKHHGQLSSVQNAILSTLTYFPHLTNFNAEVLKVVNDDFDYPQLTEEVLRDISNKEFSAKDNTGPKAISSFLVRLSELIPKIVLRQMTLIVKLLNNSSFTLRCAIVETCGNIVIDICKNKQELERYKNQVEVLLELLEERFLDSNPYVRSKAIQGCLKVCDLDAKFNKNRLNLTRLAVRSLQDRSSLVRRNSVKLLSKLILTHPFTQMHGTQLRLSQWEQRHKNALHQLDTLLKDSNEDPEEDSLEHTPEHGVALQNSHEKGHEHSENTLENETENKNLMENTQAIFKIRLTIQYYKDAVDFITIIHEGIYLACGLLFSRNRNEVLETMDFFALADAYDIELSHLGIKRMLNLVWMKGANDEGTSIASHLVDCYKDLFFTAPESSNCKEKAAYIAKNLVQLTKDTSFADLASLEKLLGLMYLEKLIDQNVVNVLWGIYNSAANKDQGTFTNDQIHGSIIVLGMLSLVDNEVALKGLDALLNSGLGEPGRKDLILSKFSCIALQRMMPGGSEQSSTFQVPREEDAVRKLHDKIIEYTEDQNFYPVCEHAINALFAISRQPDVVCSELIKEKTMMTFGELENSSAQNTTYRIVSLTQLLFIVGQVAIKTIVYLEKCEAEFKKRKIETEIAKNNRKSATTKKDDVDVSVQHEEETQKELEMIGGTNEDDFADAVHFIKENKLLFGENSLLAKFGSLVEEIVSNTAKFSDPMLQRAAVLCLEKFMCVSSKFCERNLPLLITVMEKSKDPIIRSNAVLGLGDMAVCFNNLVDENTDYLYHRLHDENIMVQRTCLMTVTFLILAGQVKVKGQLGQMAKCLEYPDQGMSDMCKLFFTELAAKDNAIYNGFIDIFSSLSNDEELKKDSFKRIMKFLLSFIEKERHQRQLCEKLLNKLSKVDTQKQWDDIAFILNTIPYKNEKITTELEKGFKLVNARE